MDDSDVDNGSEVTEKQDTPSLDGARTPELAQGVVRTSERIGWETNATIRQAYHVKFEFAHITLPETPELLTKLLQSTFPQTQTAHEV